MKECLVIFKHSDWLKNLNSQSEFLNLGQNFFVGFVDDVNKF